MKTPDPQLLGERSTRGVASKTLAVTLHTKNGGNSNLLHQQKNWTSTFSNICRNSEQLKEQPFETHWCDGATRILRSHVCKTTATWQYDRSAEAVGESSYGHLIYSGDLSVNRYACLKHNVTFVYIDSREQRWHSDRFATLHDFFEASNNNYAKMLQLNAYLTI